MDAKDIKELLRKENPIVLEIGAHIGGDTKKLLEEFKGIRVYCFEPDPRCIKIFKGSIKDARCVLIESAVSNVDGETALYLSKSSSVINFRNMRDVIRLVKNLIMRLFGKSRDSLGQASITRSVSRSSDYPWLTFNQEIKIKTLRLDTWVKENNIGYLDFIWSDVQGSERKMIEGAINALGITKYLYTEYGETSPYPEAMTRNETIELLGKYDFEIVERYSDTAKVGNLLFVNRSFI